MKTRVTDNGVFFFREKKDGTKGQFLELIEKLSMEYTEAGNIAISDFIKKHSKKLSKIHEGNKA